MESITHVTPNEQAYVFLWRFRDVPQKQVYSLQKDFYSFSKGKSELEEFDVVRLLEHRGNSKSSMELRKDVTNMINKRTKTLSFIELCCHVFEKPYRRVLFSDAAARDEALSESLAEANDPEAAKVRFAILQEVEEEAIERKRCEELITEAPAYSGVAGKAAFFNKKMVVDENKAIEMKVREEAAIRKALKKAKEDEEAAVRNEHRRKLEAEALEAERLERGVVEEPEVVEEAVEEEEQLPTLQEEEDLSDEIAAEGFGGGYIDDVASKKRKHLSMKGLKKRMINVVNAVNDHVITPLKNKLRKTSSLAVSPSEAGVPFNAPLTEEAATHEHLV